MDVRAIPAPVLDASTREVAPRDQFAHFCDALCDVYLGIRPQRVASPRFEADVLAFAWGDIVLSRMRAPGHEARRDGRDIAAKPDDALFLNFSDTSDSTVEAGGRIVQVASALPVLLDNAEPFRLRFDDARRFRLYSLRLPRDVGGHRLDAADAIALDDRLRRTAVGRQVASQVRLMTTEFDAGRVEVAGTMALAVAALVRRLWEGDATGSAAERFADYTATAAARLTDPDFGVNEIAAVHGVSPRTVQSVFAAEGDTVSRWMLRARLELARERLGARSWEGRSISQIAFASGWRDASGFHRAFRERFGDTPGSFRRVRVT